MFDMRRWLVALFILVFSLAVTPSFANSSNCNCPPHYCANPAKAKKLKEVKKAQMRRSGYPERLINMVDELPDCDYCINTAPDGFNIRMTYNNGNSMSMGWSRHNEYLARKGLKSGKIKKFELVYTAKPCHCCPKEEYDGSLPPAIGIGTTFDDPDDLGVMPPDLTHARPATGTQSVPPPPKVARPKPPRIAQALCPACKGLIDQYNALMNKIYETELAIYNANKTAHILFHALQLDLDRIDQIQQLAHTPETAAQLAKAESIYSAHVSDYQKELAKLAKLKEELKSLQAQVADLEKKIDECEKTQCHYRPPVYREPNPKPQPQKPEVTKGPSLGQLFNLGVHVSWDTLNQSADVLTPSTLIDQSNASDSNLGFGLDAMFKPHWPIPVFVYAEISRPGQGGERIFDKNTDSNAGENSTVDTKRIWQALLGAGVNVWHANANHITVGLGALLGLTDQKITSRVSENNVTEKSASQWLFTPGAMLQAQVPLCKSCFIHRPLMLTGRFLWLHIPSQNVLVTKGNNNAYTSTAQSSSEYRGEVALSTTLP